MIIKKNKIPPKKIEATCEYCNETYLVDKEDIKAGVWGFEGFECPECGHFVTASDKRTILPTYPTTFMFHEDAVHISDEEIDGFVNKVATTLKTLAPGEFTIAGTGDTLVFGLKFEDEENIYVCRDYSEDWIDTTN